MLEELPLDPSKSEDVEFLDEERTPAWLVRLACAAHASATSLSECSDLLAWFGVDRTRQAVWYWYQAYGDYHDEEFTAEPECVAVDEKQVQLPLSSADRHIIEADLEVIRSLDAQIDRLQREIDEIAATVLIPIILGI